MSKRNNDSGLMSFLCYVHCSVVFVCMSTVRLCGVRLCVLECCRICVYLGVCGVFVLVYVCVCVCVCVCLCVCVLGGCLCLLAFICAIACVCVVRVC